MSEKRTHGGETKAAPTSLDLVWQDADLPMSRAFDDPFYSRRDGRAEVEHVFLGGNDLPQRWTDTQRFHIAELGFGTGLNAVETWRVWIETRRPGQHLTFTSFERFPLAAEDTLRALKPWSDLTDLTAQMAALWRETEALPVRGGDLDDQTRLQVIIGEAESSVMHWDGAADAWFLDGFAPAKNPDMWSTALMQAVFGHTRPGGSFATYTAAGWVRRNLQAAGFTVEKRKGHGGKREMACGWRPPKLSQPD